VIQNHSQAKFTMEIDLKGDRILDPCDANPYLHPIVTRYNTRNPTPIQETLKSTKGTM